ncbi:MAG: hypothetical protein IJR90_06230 [Clostridia bacterium]|nr:hypothetical protein [Clostridia bacterium]
MSKKDFEIVYSPETGGISSIIISGDEHRMNWVESAAAVWGAPYYNAQVSFNRYDPLRLVSFSEERSVYENALARIAVTRRFGDEGRFEESYVFENISCSPLFVRKGEFGISTPFNDSYADAALCLTSRCHTHIFCGGTSSWVCALRMGESDKNLGLVLTEGTLDCYRQWLPPYAKNDRGDLMLCAAPFDLLPGEKYTLSWTLFVHSGNGGDARDNSFFSQIEKIAPQKILMRFDHDTVFAGEDLIIDLRSKNSDLISAVCSVNGENAAKRRVDKDGAVSFSYTPKAFGELTVKVRCGEETVVGRAFCSPRLEELIGKRVDFICRKQQYHSPGHPLDGAYLIYDNESDSLYFSNNVADHNASRERIGMGILVAKYLQKNHNDAARSSLDDYVGFVLREFVDPETGDVFDTIGRDPTQIRLYNAPWVCVFMCELYKLRGDKKYLAIASRVMKKYYDGGGDRFYPNAFSPAEPVRLMREAGMDREADELFDSIKRHCGNIIANGIEYPKHEVDYEQTIVAPALTFLLQAYELTGDKNYLDNAVIHLKLLDRFNGFQPDHRLDEVAIRHWDDYWFGKSAMFGDTLPHYWSVLSGWCKYLYYRAADIERFRLEACNSARNCLSLFSPDGKASCAYVYPYMVNDKRGEFCDAWANDQDFALYFAIKILEGEE